MFPADALGHNALAHFVVSHLNEKAEAPFDSAFPSIFQKTIPLLQPSRRIPLGFNVYHVQGLALTGRSFFVSSIDLWRGHAWVYRVDRAGRREVARRRLTEKNFIHPGGMSFDGRWVWIPNAEYDRDGPSRVMALDPESLDRVTTFEVDDHISLVAADGRDRLYGTNWDSRHFYVWNYAGQLLARVKNPTRMAYQDCQYLNQFLLCGGYRNREAVLDVIDPETWKLVHRIPAGKTAGGKWLTREGLSFSDGRIYLIPEDGSESAILVFDV